MTAQLIASNIWVGWWQDMESARYVCQTQPAELVQEALDKVRTHGSVRIPDRDFPAFSAWLDSLAEEVRP